MTTPLLTTKLYIPPPRPKLVPRPHLVQRLDDGVRLGRRLTFISAPAGFGKTTLLSEWVHRSSSPRVAWLFLDEGDNDPGRFLTYFIGALQTVHRNVGESVLAARRGPQSPPVELLLTMLINEVAEKTESTLFVLDDFHLIQAAPIHDALTFLLDHLPPSLHLAIASRVDPPLPLPRLRARDHVTEIRAADLRFTPDETAAFLNQVMYLGLSAGDVAALEARTEGWIAGLQLAALSMQGRADVSGFVAAFTGSNRYILDYLVEEVLRRQPEDVQSFLLQTAILDRMTGELCNALTGRADGQAMIEALEGANLFIVPLDQDRIWYRYHRLFAEFLRNRLEQPASSDVVLVAGVKQEMSDLHCRASEWYEGQGLLPEAVTHALEAQDLARAARLIEVAARGILMRGETSTILRWLEALPDDLIRSRPTLSLARAWALVITSQLDAAEDYIRAAFQAAAADDAEIQGEAATIRTFISTLKGDVPGTIQLAHQALEHLAPDDLSLRGMVAMNLGLAYDTRGDVEAASQAYVEARAISLAADNPLVSLMAITQLADIKLLQGELYQAADTYREALKIAAEPGKRLPIAGIAYSGLGQLMYEWNDLDTAGRYLSTGIELSRQWEINDILVFCSIHLARVRQAAGDIEGAWDLAQQVDQGLKKPMTTSSTITTTRAYQARLWLKQGDLQAATRWAEEYQADPGDAHAHERQIEGTTWARVLLARGQPEPIIGQLDTLLQVAERAGQMGNVIELLALQALALQALGQSAQAQQTLARALALARPSGYVRIFVDEGQQMAKLLRQTQARGVEAEYVNKLLAVFERTTMDDGRRMEKVVLSSALRPSSPLVESLSPRELEVLELLATGLSNREIALKLVIAVGTVKQHLKSIYGKLEVHNRTEAARRARELGLF